MKHLKVGLNGCSLGEGGVSSIGVKALGLALSLFACFPVHASNGGIVPAGQLTTAQQQAITVKGHVTDPSGEPLVGVTVSIVGASQGTVTDIDGNFSLQASRGDRLRISYVGYQTQEVTVSGASVKVVLTEDSKSLDEVVVTALGIKREKKALGYAIQEVKGDQLVAARENNLANALTGQVSGLQIIRSSNGPAGSSKIQLRGSNSVTGTNQPLIVVDGIPLDNFTGTGNNDFWNPGTDMGNGLADINSEDIASLSVLKGASAAALYGSRAGNGVILITTKKGSKSNGLGITVSASVAAESVFMNPERQKTFGQGSEGTFNAKAGSNWGPEITGQTYTDWAGKEQQMRYYDNVKNFFNTGVNFTESVAFSQQFNKTSVYVSGTRMDDGSKIPGADYNRTNLMSRVFTSFGKDDRWTLDSKIQYIRSYAKNRPISGANTNNYFYTMYTMPISLDITQFKNSVNPADGSMYWWEKGSGQNPYWAKDFNTNEDLRNRFLLNFSLKYQFTDWLSAEAKAGSDIYFTESETKLYAGSPSSATGRYSFGEQKFYENNFSLLLTAQKDNVLGKFGGALTLGGNLMERKSTGLSNSVSELIVPNLFWLTNSSQSNRSINPTFSHRKTNSLYGSLSINYDGWAFLEGTFRNDWSSTLSKDNRSYFYPSVSASWVVSDMLSKMDNPLPKWFTYAKARVSFAQVGNDLDPYQLYNTYSVGTVPFTDGISASDGSTLFDSSVRSELISSWEAGLEIRFLDNRLGLDVAWYKSNARRQLLNLPINGLSGHSSKKINAGDIQNSGLEIMLNATPVLTKDFRWDSQLNFSNNKNEIIEFTEGIDEYILGGFDNLKIIGKAGGNYGEIWGTTFKRVTDEKSPYYGKLLLNSDGIPQGNSELSKIGDQQADCLLGWTNTLTYKNFSLSFMIDGRFGGHIFSGSNMMLQRNGVAEVTAPGGKRDKMVVDGVVADGKGGYTANTKEITQQQYWTALTGSTGNLGIGEANLYSATNVRLRTLSLSYAFKPRNSVFQQVKLGVACNNVLMLKSNLHGLDPEAIFATNTNATGFEYAAPPTSRSFIFNVSFGF